MLGLGNILIVEDDLATRRLVGGILERENFVVGEAVNGEEMRTALSASTPDLIILDLTLGNEDGFDLAREIRSSSDISIIILSSKDDVIDKIVGLELGADDYITKPFNSREFIARIKAVLRRNPRNRLTAMSMNDIIKFAGWTLDLGSHKLTSPTGEDVYLTTYEFKALSQLARRPQRVLSRNEILDFVADRDWEPSDRSVDVLITKIRRKLKENPKDPKIIRTIRNTGYMIVAKVKKSTG